MLTRENILSGYVQRMVAQRDGGWSALEETALIASRKAVLERLKPGEDVWIFGYGSLMWNPAFHFVETNIGTVHGYHRRFCLWTTLGRGSPENPGLMLGLERGGSLRGLAMRVAPEAVESETDIIWKREMLRGAYAPRWVNVRTDKGILRAITFVINHNHSAYAGILPEKTVVDCLATASGRLGACSEYLSNTVAHLRDLGIDDRHMSALLAGVQGQRAAS